MIKCETKIIQVCEITIDRATSLYLDSLNNDLEHLDQSVYINCEDNSILTQILHPIVNATSSSGSYTIQIPARVATWILLLVQNPRMDISDEPPVESSMRHDIWYAITNSGVSLLDRYKVNMPMNPPQSLM